MKHGPWGVTRSSGDPLPLLLLITGLFLSHVSHAQSEVCSNVPTFQDISSHLNDAEARLAGGQLDASTQSLSKAHKKLLCVDQIVPPALMAHLGQLFSMAFFFDQDDDAASRWMRSGDYASPGREWPDMIAAGHPLRGLESDLDKAVSGPKGYGLLVPKKASFFMNGRFSDRPLALVETPLLIQIVDRKGTVEASWWQDGAAFPKERLIEGGPLLLPPRWLAAKDIVPTPTPTPTPALTQDPAVSKQAEPIVQYTTPSETKVYVDPFEDARTRRVLREKSERTIESANGGTTIVRTEIISYIPDPSAGRPVTYQHFEQWLQDSSQWHKNNAIQAGTADGSYLTGWTETRHPDGMRRDSVVWISFSAARAYCESFGGGLETRGDKDGEAPKWEWRLIDDRAVRVNALGKIKEELHPENTYPDVGFRCLK